MIRHLLSDAGRPLREQFVWHLVPVMNVGSLYGQNPASNMNRDWETFKMPETVGARDYIKKIIAGGGRLLHGIDLHMGWSNRKSSGASMTAMRKGAAPEAIIARQEAFAKHTFANCDWTQENICRSEHKDGIPFYHWAVKELGIAMQTAEFSRHIVWERDRQRNGSACARNTRSAWACSSRRRWGRLTGRVELKRRNASSHAATLILFVYSAAPSLAVRGAAFRGTGPERGDVGDGPAQARRQLPRIDL